MRTYKEKSTSRLHRAVLRSAAGDDFELALRRFRSLEAAYERHPAQERVTCCFVGLIKTP